MAKSCTVLGPFSQKEFVDDVSAIQTAITTAIGSNTCTTADPFTVLGNIYIIVTTS